MGLTHADITTVFKMLGKYAFLVNQVTRFKATYDEGLMNLIQQSMGDHSGECKKTLFGQIIVSLNANAGRVSGIAGQAPALIVDSAFKYLKQVVAIMAGMNPQQDIPLKNLMFIIRTAMYAGGLYLNKSGPLAEFIAGTLGYQEFPTSGTTLIPDDYVTGEVI